MNLPRPCPRCSITLDVVLNSSSGIQGADYCPNCGGLFLESNLSEKIFYEQLSLDLTFLKELSQLYAGIPLQCSACPSKMKSIQLQDVMVDICFHCGGLWCDRGELIKVSQGLFKEPSWEDKKEQTPPKRTFLEKIKHLSKEVEVKVISNLAEIIKKSEHHINSEEHGLESREKFYFCFMPLNSVNKERIKKIFIDASFLIASDFRQWQYRFQGFLKLVLFEEQAKELYEMMKAESISCRLYREYEISLPQIQTIKDFEVVQKIFNNNTLLEFHYTDEKSNKKMIHMNDEVIVGCSYIEKVIHNSGKRKNVDAFEYFKNPQLFGAFSGINRSASGYFSASGGIKNSNKSTQKVIEMRVDFYIPKSRQHLCLPKVHFYIKNFSVEKQLTRKDKELILWQDLIRNLALIPKQRLFLCPNLEVAFSEQKLHPDTSTEQDYLDELKWTALKASSYLLTV